jgi:hypothetical protein
MVLLTDLYDIWPQTIWDDLVPTRDLVAKLINHHPDYWGAESAYGKPLTETRFGKLVAQASKATSMRPGGRGPRGFCRFQLEPAWRQLGIGAPLGEPGAPGEPGAVGAFPQHVHQVHRDNQLHRVETEAPLACACGAELTEPDSIRFGACQECRLDASKDDELPD